jgi:hypothetical protein
LNLADSQKTALLAALSMLPASEPSEPAKQFTISVVYSFLAVLFNL